MKTSIVFLALLLTGCNKLMPLVSTTRGQALASQPGSANVPVIIVAGQSNAVGFGQNMASPIGPEITWVGLDFPRGIGVSFAQGYLQDTQRPEVIVIQCAVGATSIDQWAANGALNTQCMDFYKQVQASTPTAHLAAILFWQGESDTAIAGIPWASEFTALINSWRSNFGVVPVIYCQLAADPHKVGFHYWPDIQAEQAKVSIPFVSMVKTSDFNSFAVDGVHVEQPALDAIGHRMAQAYYGIIHA